MNATETANRLSKEDIITHYHTNYQLTEAEYAEIDDMTVEELRKMYIEGESF